MDRRTDRRTDGPMDATDTVTYRIACPRLKMSAAFFFSKVEQSPDSLLEIDVFWERNSAMEKKQCLEKKTFVYRIAKGKRVAWKIYLKHEYEHGIILNNHLSVNKKGLFGPCFFNCNNLFYVS